MNAVQFATTGLLFIASAAFPTRWLLARRSAALINALDQIRAILSRMTHDHQESLTPLDDAVRDFARRARANNVPPERVLVSLGALLNGPAAAGIGQWWRSVLRDRCVREAIESYYAIDIAQANPDTIDPAPHDKTG